MITKMFNKNVLLELQPVESALILDDATKKNVQNASAPNIVYQADKDTGLSPGDKVLLNIQQGMQLMTYKIDGKEMIVVPFAFILCTIS